MNELDVLEAFVLMPSGNNGEYEKGPQEADFIYKHIIQGALAVTEKQLNRKIEVLREIDNRATGSISADIVRRVAQAHISIVDITGMNPNVFFELGIRYALRRSLTVLLRRREVRIPFDITAYRAITYDILSFEDSMQELAEVCVNSLKRHSPPCDSLVFDVLPHLEVRIPKIYDSTEAIEGSFGGPMPWHEFWDRVKEVKLRLRSPVMDGRYVPDIILGITNGGLIVADILGRELFTKTPVVSLWADRNAPLKMFDNEINVGLINALGESLSRLHREPEILLVDDIVASGSTLSQARAYLEGRLSGCVRFIALFSRNERYRDIIQDFLLYEDPRIPVGEGELGHLLYTERRRLPYDKDIRSA